MRVFIYFSMGLETDVSAVHHSAFSLTHQRISDPHDAISLTVLKSPLTPGGCISSS